MDFSWGPSVHDDFGSLTVQLANGGMLRCGEVYPKHSGRSPDRWTYVLSLRISPVHFVVEDHVFDTKREAQEALQSMATALIIGGNHERNRTKDF
jgi:hypothetical protein